MVSEPVVAKPMPTDKCVAPAGTAGVDQLPCDQPAGDALTVAEDQNLQMPLWSR